VTTIDDRKSVVQRLVRLVRPLASNPRPNGCEKLSGADKYRIRQGDYRILYEIDDTMRLVTIVKLGKRREVYR
jgi:mRNA interferase RelE/StbE